MTQTAEQRSTPAMAELPDVAEFPSRPATWYLFCRSHELREKPISKTIMQRRLVAYRGASGGITVLDANCAHLGADLGRGNIVGDSIQCPFHHWRYGSNGRCVATAQPGAEPPEARLRSYPAVERHGYIFFFFAPRVRFPLPFFADCDPEDFVASSPFRFEMDCPWHMLVANGFDTQHFHAVHDRKLKSSPRVDCPAPLARRMRFDAEVTGTSIFDRLLKRFVGRDVRISITSWAGPHVLVEGVFGKAHSRLLVASQPLDEHHTVSEVIVFAKRRGRMLAGNAVDKLNLRVRRRFTRAFLQYDIDKLAGVRYQPAGLTPHDLDMAEYFHWLATLPRSEYEAD